MSEIMIKNKKGKTYKSIDVEISADRTVVQKEAENKLDYKRIWIEVKLMWNMKCEITPVIYRGNRILTGGLRKNLEAIAGKPSTD